MATLVIAVYMVLMTGIIIETQSVLYQMSDSDDIDRLYRDIRRECQVQADYALSRIQSGEPASSVKDKFLTTFISNLRNYGTFKGISTQIEIDSDLCVFTSSLVSIPDITITLTKGDSYLKATFSIESPSS